MTALPDDRSASMGCGAILHSGGTCCWRVWAPRAQSVELVLFGENGGRTVCPMYADERRIFTCSVSGILEGQRYAYSLDGDRDLPDPASRWQPDGVHAPSSVWDPSGFSWTDSEWKGISRQDLVIYELHVGSFTEEGTFASVIPRLAALKDLGITAIELMPVAQFPGRQNWGYDGAYWYAVQNSYGGPRELQRLVDACHAAGLAVILDVVYNHLGPEGNYLNEFGPYFTDRYQTPWGWALNYDDGGSDEVRDFVLHSVRQWVRDFHVDGLRLDAVHAIYDYSPRHILADIKRVADAARSGWPVHIIAESNLNDVRLLRPAECGGDNLDAQWSDDFHHCVHTLLTHEQSGYYCDFSAPAQQLAKVLNSTFAYDGNYSRFRGRRHGAPDGSLPGDRFIVSIQTHDQVGNRARGERLSVLVNPAGLRLAAALLMLSPYTPLLFMGEEYGEERPFPFFCDFGDPALQEAVRIGRRQEFAEFAWSGDVPDPQNAATFLDSKLAWTWPEGTWQAGLRRLYRDLLAARRRWSALGDRTSRQAELISLPEGNEVLRLVRGATLPISEQIVAYFNLGPSRVRIPVDLEQGLLLRTEDVQYGSDADLTCQAMELNPLECSIFGPSQEICG